MVCLANSRLELLLQQRQEPLFFHCYSHYVRAFTESIIVPVSSSHESRELVDTERDGGDQRSKVFLNVMSAN